MLGGSHFFCENQPVPVLTSCYDNLIGSLIYIYIYIYIGLVRTDRVLRIFIFSKFTRFSNRVILAYIITLGSLARFSQPGSFFWKLIFNLILI